MQTKTDIALESFNQGYNCAQSILSSYCDSFGMDRETALRVATGFGAGMGRMQETCGLLTGAFMLIGLKYSMLTPKESADKERAYALIQELARVFKGRHGTLLCRELTGYSSLQSKAEIRQFAHDPERAERCRACLRTVTAFIENNLTPNDKNDE